MKSSVKYNIPATNTKVLSFFDDLARRKTALRLKLEKRMKALRA